MTRLLSALLLIGLLALAAAYAGSPIFAYSQLKDAARAGDHDRLEALVDFPAVRENLKRQVDSKAVKAARTASGISYPVIAILGHLGAALGDKAVDKLVTPESISAMITLGEARRGHRHKDKDAADEAAASQSQSRSHVQTSYGYLTPDRFRVTVAPATHPDLAVALIMDRQGLFAWRVKEIELPGK